MLEREERMTSAMLGEEVEGVAGAMPEKELSVMDVNGENGLLPSLQLRRVTTFFPCSHV